MHIFQTRAFLAIGLVCSLLVCFTRAQSSNATQSHFSTSAIPRARMVKDIESNVSSGKDALPEQFTAVGNTIFFVAEDDTNARELWKTDGTQAGTALVRDITPGAYVPSGPNLLTSFNNTLYFFIKDQDDSIILWHSDGTTNRTTPIITMPNDVDYIPYMNVINGRLLFFAQLRSSSNLYYLYESDGTESGTIVIKQITIDLNAITVANNQLFFVATDGTTGNELWKSDGTAGGTTLVKDIYPGSGSAFNSPFSLNSNPFTVVGNKLFFVANDGTTGHELWQSDGTTGRTTLVEDIAPGAASSSLTQLTAVGTTLFFIAGNENRAYSLWKTDGSAGNTVQVQASDQSFVYGASNLISVGTQLFFWQFQSDSFRIIGTSLWRSDGTAAGTVQITSFSPNDPQNPSPFIRNDYGQKAVGNKLFFAANGDVWVSDGSETGTHLLKEILPNYGSPQIGQFTVFQGMLLFSASNGNYGVELWKSDGTEAGTAPLISELSGKHVASPSHLTTIGSHIFFVAGDNSPSKPWVSDGTSAGTFLLKDINADGNSSFGLWQLQNTGYRTREADTVTFKGLLFSSANNTDGTADGLWKSDGTETGTALVKAFKGGLDDKWMPFDLTVASNILFFATTTEGGWTLWKSDGSEQGTVIVKQFISSNYSNRIIDQLTNVNGTLFFTALAPQQGYELWKSDGTADGTVVVKDITPGYDDSKLEQLTPIGNTLFFSYANDSHNTLWKSDGTEAGTVPVKPLDADSSTFYYGYFLVPVGDTLFFSVIDNIHGSELWKSDGTGAGTVLVKDINPGNASSHPFGLSALNGMLYFAADDGTHGHELWKSDGTENGTVLVRDINPQANIGSISSSIQAVGDGVVFLANDGTHGTELWSSDGTETGTLLLKDLVPGTQQWELPFFEATPLPDGKRALLDVYTADTGIELWVSDGTPKGTLQVQDIAPGPASADPSNIRIVGDRAFFVADDTVHGRELWSLNLADLPTSNESAPDTPTPDMPTPYVPTAQRSIFLPSVTK